MHYHRDKKLPEYHTVSLLDNGFYEPQPGLTSALDAALELRMPLLLTGEPGTGKTRFAKYVAAHFGLGEPLVFNAKTTSTATDLFYRYDALRHFHLINNLKEEPADLLEAGIIRYAALGQAIVRARDESRRSVVLIDEIDKASRDFPNDLLDLLDGDFRFELPELQREALVAPAALKPLVIITSNSEKNLPEPFLRRCVYFHLDFPAEAHLLRIVSGKIERAGLLGFFEEKDLRALLRGIFFPLRQRASQRGVKAPATAELVAWLHVLHQLGIGPADFQPGSPRWEAACQSYSLLAKSEDLLTGLRKDPLVLDPNTIFPRD